MAQQFLTLELLMQFQISKGVRACVYVCVCARVCVCVCVCLCVCVVCDTQKILLGASLSMITQYTHRISLQQFSPTTRIIKFLIDNIFNYHVPGQPIYEYKQNNKKSDPISRINVPFEHLIFRPVSFLFK